MARQDSMAKISAALARSHVQPGPETNTDDVSPDVTIAPGVSANAPITERLPEITEGQKRAFEVNRQRERDALSDRRQDARDKEALFRQQIATEQAEQDAFKSSAQATTNAVKRIVRGTGVTLGNIPQPGSILLPLTVLIVFFLLLLPVNGHTRFVWLWLVLSGNAQIGQATATPTASTGTAGQETGFGVTGPAGNSSGSGSTATSTAPVQFTVPTSFINNLLSGGTYVEEVS